MLPPKPPSIPDEPHAHSPAPKRGDGFTIVALIFSGLAVIGGALAFLRTSQTYEVVADLKQAVATLKTDESAPRPVQPAPAKVSLDLDERDPASGNRNATVTVVEFSDFECPFCGRFSETVKQIRKAYSPDQVTFVYLDFPLTSIHDQAQPAAIAAQCVADLAGDDAFYQYHDALFTNQETLGDKLYSSLAATIPGLDLQAFERCYTNKESLSEVQADYQQGLKLQVSGTPSVFINGNRVNGGAVPFETLKALIDTELAK